MSEDKLKKYVHAMTIDPDTGKPMPKVSVQGGSSGESVVFPEDFPDIESQALLDDISKNSQGVNSKTQTVIDLLTSINEHLSVLTDPNTVFKVENVVQEETGEE